MRVDSSFKVRLGLVIYVSKNKEQNPTSFNYNDDNNRRIYFTPSDRRGGPSRPFEPHLGSTDLIRTTPVSLVHLEKLLIDPKPVPLTGSACTSLFNLASISLGPSHWDPPTGTEV